MEHEEYKTDKVCYIAALVTFCLMVALSMSWKM